MIDIYLTSIYIFYLIEKPILAKQTECDRNTRVQVWLQKNRNTIQCKPNILHKQSTKAWMLAVFKLNPTRSLLSLDNFLNSWLNITLDYPLNVLFKYIQFSWASLRLNVRNLYNCTLCPFSSKYWALFN